MKKYIFKFNSDLRFESSLDSLDAFIKASDEYSTKIQISLSSEQMIDIYVTSDGVDTPTVYLNLRDEEDKS
jgi:hypothetical protein